MRKVFLIILFAILINVVYSQERFFNLYPGWVIDFTYEDADRFNFYGLDTIDLGYSNTPIQIELSVTRILDLSHVN